MTWFKLDRDILDHPIWTADQFSRGQAWVDLIGLAQFKAGHFYKRGVRIDYERGDVTISVLGLADRWRWSESKVERFLQQLKKDGQISKNKIHRVTTLISITNYDTYQSGEEQTKNKRRTNEEQTKIYKEGKEGYNTTTTITREKKKFEAPARNEVIAFFLDHGYEQLDAEEFFDYWEGEAWIRKNNTPVRSWQATARNRFKALNKHSEDDKRNTKSRHWKSDAIANW